MSEWFRNGERVSTVAIDDRGLHYGDGLFETVAIRNGAPRLWTYHMDRLRQGCEVLGITPPAVDALESNLFQSLRMSSIQRDMALAKIILTAESGQRGYARRAGANANVVIGIFPAVPLENDAYRAGVDTMRCHTRLAHTPILAGLKTLNRLEQVLARSEVLDKGLFEGLTMDADGHVICGTMSNVFFVRNNLISTPPLDRCGVNGIMRRHIIQTLNDSGTEVALQSLRVEALGDVDEMFLSNSQFGVLPVRCCDNLNWPVGEFTRRVMGLMADNQIGECRV